MTPWALVFYIPFTPVAGLAASPEPAPIDVPAIDRARVLAAADRDLAESPVTITAARSPRSAGGPHDFFSEGDYWWPDPLDGRGMRKAVAWMAPFIRDKAAWPDSEVEEVARSFFIRQPVLWVPPALPFPGHAAR